MNDFLPDGYKKPVTASNYIKLEQGENKLRILSPAITGYIVWSDEKPHRFKTAEEVDVTPSRAGDKVKHFWAMKVFDYKDNRVKVWEVTQASIQETLLGLSGAEEYGNPTGYDLKITRSGEKLDTSYMVLPMPPKEVSEDVAQADKDISVNLEALFSGEDCFETDKVTPSATQPF